MGRKTKQGWALEILDDGETVDTKPNLKENNSTSRNYQINIRLSQNYLMIWILGKKRALRGQKK